MKVGKIYKITNTVNNKVYIGQTILDNPMHRWKEHYDGYKSENNQLFLYRAMRKSGITNFIFQIIEDNISLKEINNREKYWIQYYNSNNENYGYNLTLGGDSSYNSKYSEEFIRTIILEIQKNPEVSLTDIGKKYNVSPATMSDINTGETWNFKDIIYPIRKNNRLNLQIALEIIQKLQEGYNCSQLSKIYNISVTSVANINNGKSYFQKDLTYPIHKSINSKKRLEVKDVENIINILLTTRKTYNAIGNELNIGRKTISNIDQGKGYREIVESLGYINFPIRANYKVYSNPCTNISKETV